MAFFTRGLIIIFGYSYPAYECYKTVEKNKVNIEQLRFWCQYWILVALLTVFEKIAEIFVSWIPMFLEGKLVFFIYLWSSKTKGATYVYESFLRPYLSKHEKDIDRYLLELRTRAVDILALYWKKAASYGQTTFFGIIQLFAAQSLATQSDQLQQQQQQSTHPNSSNGTTQLQREANKETAPTSGTPTPQTTMFDQVVKDVMDQKKQSEGAEKNPESVLKTSNGDMNQPQAILRDETARVVRARLKKNRATVSSSSVLPLSPKQNVNTRSRQ